jgi:RIO kinase 1
VSKPSLLTSARPSVLLLPFQEHVLSRKPFDDDDLADRVPLPELLAELSRASDPTFTDETAEALGLDFESADRLSTYPDASHGPEPVPEWVITTANAYDEELGALKSGKEADVRVVRRTALADGAWTLLASKQFRDADHRNFHRDAGYLEGRKTRRSRNTRAMATRTTFGRELIAGQWASAEFQALSLLWAAGIPVPYPVSFDGEELLMEFIGDEDGTAAPRLAAVRPSHTEIDDLLGQALAALRGLAELGYAHGDLSPYNVLVYEGRLVLIDLPQVVDLVGNPQGPEFLMRDARNLLGWFATKGAVVDVEDVVRELRAITPR